VGEWPGSADEWSELARASQLQVTETTEYARGDLGVELSLEMPSAVLVELVQD
jgi:hypothetical protein